MSDVRKRIEDDYDKLQGLNFQPKVLVTATQLPSGAIETSENRENIPQKLQYILNAYDKDMRLKTCESIQMVGYLLVVKPS